MAKDISLLDTDYRGIFIYDLLALLQRYEDIAFDFTTAMQPPAPKGYTLFTEELPKQVQHEIELIKKEILRRRNMIATPRSYHDHELIDMIKDRIPIADIIEQYTEIVTTMPYNKAQLKYRCTLHGDGVDKHPAGVIYVNEKRFWCFVCNKGGDVIDAVTMFGHVDKGQAIAMLAKSIGMDTRPSIPLPKLTIKGGIPYDRTDTD